MIRDVGSEVFVIDMKSSEKKKNGQIDLKEVLISKLKITKVETVERLLDNDERVLRVDVNLEDEQGELWKSTFDCYPDREIDFLFNLDAQLFMSSKYTTRRCLIGYYEMIMECLESYQEAQEEFSSRVCDKLLDIQKKIDEALFKGFGMVLCKGDDGRYVTKIQIGV